MKHSLGITLFLVGLFVAAQIIGISLVFLDQDVSLDSEGNQHVTFQDTAIGKRPDLAGQQSFWLVIAGVAIGTALIFLLIRLKIFALWKLWFFLAVWLSLTIAFAVVMPVKLAYLFAAILAGIKIFKPNSIIHNLTELFIYAGITLLLAPIFDLFWMTMLLLAISVYDMIAVWKSKHMITLAKEQSKHSLFAGLSIPKGKTTGKTTGKKVSVAVLGGGDIAFPLLFSSVVLVWLIETNIAPMIALWLTLIITVTATAALAGLFAQSEKGKFYPAMPFLSIGCFLGFGIIYALVHFGIV